MAMRDSQLSIAISDDFRALLVERARVRRISVAALVREVLEAAIKPAPVTRPTPPKPRTRPARATARWCTRREDSLRSKEG